MNMKSKVEGGEAGQKAHTCKMTHILIFILKG